MGKLTNLNPPAAIADADIPALIARDAEVTAALSAHTTAPNPHTQYKLSGSSEVFTATTKAVGRSSGIISASTSTAVNLCGLEVQASDSSSAAFLSFHRPFSGANAAGVHFGLDADNQLKFGGWSYGQTAWKVWHEAFGTPVWQTPSDSRLKQDIRPIPSALSILLECKPVSFRYNRTIREKRDFFGNPFQREKIHYGFLANDFPLQDLVWETDGHLGIDYLEVIPFLCRAIQEQQSQIDELRKLLK
jgi:hypothetical protein